MKKVTKTFIMGLAAVTTFTLGIISASANEFEDELESDAKIPQYLYYQMSESGDLASYIYMDRPVSLEEAKSFINEYPEFEVTQTTDEYVMGVKEISGGTHEARQNIAITTDGLFTSYMRGIEAPTSPAVIHANDADVTSNEEPLAEVLTASIRNLLGPRIEEYNYMYMAEPEGNKFLHILDSDHSDNFVQFEENANVTHFSVNHRYNIESNFYSPNFIIPGERHTINDRDDIYLDGDFVGESFGDSDRNHFAFIEDIGTVETDRDLTTYNLRNNFVPYFADIKESYWAHDEIEWSVKNELVQGYADGTFRPSNELTEAQFVSIMANYFEIDPEQEYGHWAQPLYDQFRSYDLPLNGYDDDSAKNESITRGEIAQVLAASQGESDSLESAVDFLFENNISTGRDGEKTLESYNPDEVLNRSQVSAFFQRMQENDLNELE